MAEIVARKNEIVNSFRSGVEDRVADTPISPSIADMAASPARMRSRSTARRFQAKKSSSTPARVPASCLFPN